ncbi:MAG: hypothetical protein KAS72_13580 [Phycisphaerales bacterium]|nr:hypothetical protein [Phycisphaerales bacterium]
MIRHIITIAICLVMGLMTSVVVAWGLALWTKPPEFPRIDQWLQGEEAKVYWGDRTPAFREEPIEYVYVAGERLGRTKIRVSAAGAFLLSADQRVGRPMHSIHTTRVGLPMRCLEGENHSVLQPPGSTSWYLHGAVARPDWLWVPAGVRVPANIVPLSPIWVGLVADSVCYGLLFFLAFLGGKHGRRFARRKRGRCPLCAYDLRGELDAGCPECGWNRGTACSVERSAARRG